MEPPTAIVVGMKHIYLLHPFSNYQQPGGGAGGVAVAARLAKKGYKVTVVEKNADIGGRCSLMQEDDYVRPYIYPKAILTAVALRPRPFPSPHAVLLPPDLP